MCSLKVLNTPGGSSFTAGAKKIDFVHVQKHIQAMTDICRAAYPNGCDPATKSNARTDLRQLNAGLQQSSAFHYSNCCQGRKRGKDMCIMPA